MAGEVDFNYFLARKYAVLQQQADSGSEQARATTTNAATAQMTGAAAANVDNTRAKLMPAESAAQIALQRAQTTLTGNQAQTVIPLANANIANIGANTALTGTQNKVLTRNELTPRSQLFGGVAMGTTPGMGFRFSEGGLPAETQPLRRRGENGASYMDRTGWGL